MLKFKLRGKLRNAQKARIKNPSLFYTFTTIQLHQYIVSYFFTNSNNTYSQAGKLIVVLSFSAYTSVPKTSL
jgi:hypothetical protein